MPPTTGQLVLLTISLLLFAVAGALSVARLRWDGPRLRVAAQVCVACGIAMATGVLVWHSIDRGQWLPLGDNFDSLVWMGLLLALFVVYVQWRKPLGGLEWFVMPLVVVLFIAAAIFGSLDFNPYV